MSLSDSAASRPGDHRRAQDARAFLVDGGPGDRVPLAPIRDYGRRRVAWHGLEMREAAIWNAAWICAVLIGIGLSLLAGVDWI